MSEAGTIGLPVSFARCAGAFLGIALGRVDAGPDRRGAHVDGVQMFLGLTQQRDLAFQRRRESVEFLSDRHGHGILQFGAAHLDDVDVRVALCAE